MRIVKLNRSLLQKKKLSKSNQQVFYANQIVIMPYTSKCSTFYNDKDITIEKGIFDYFFAYLC